MKEMRFSDFVKRAGPPKTASLWTDPAKDKEFMRAVKENRVLTIVRDPHGKHKDFGEIGFHEQPLALYMIFPKPLPKKTDARVIGVKYDLIEEPEVKNPVRNVKPQSPKSAAPKQIENEYKVVIRRTATTTFTLDLTAKNEREAKKQALAAVKEQSFELNNAKIENEIQSVRKT
ncbi:MAG TPA: hypothetical protein VFB72_00700 [Verrucomicrobiae bacterium]|nr:hypothetical protein [Verrucomicrobiae bacterium]